LSSGLGGLNAYIGDCRQTSYRLGFLHGDLLNSFEIAYPVAKGIDDIDVLDVWDSVSSIVEIFHEVPKAFIMLLLYGLQGLSCR
jgi:hypothetical protein